ncbi:MAG: hypothetical protein II002_08290, partial [Bacteroidales bacterium]|nr:hypothetical protein [Bacteroidales bacterium]
MKLKAFHAYDIRGHFGTDLTEDLAYKVAYFLPELLDTHRILLGRDMRLSSPALHEAVLRGLLDAGAEVWDLGLSTTPFVYYVTARHGFKASIQITASHNPKEDNGLKISRELALPVGYDSGLQTIERWILEERPTPVQPQRGTVHDFDVREEYIEFLNAFKKDFSNLKIAMDCSNGMASIFVHQIFGEQPLYLYDTLVEHHTGVVVVLVHHVGQVLPPPLIEVFHIVVQGLVDVPVVDVFVHDQHAQPVADLQRGLGAGVVGRAQGVVAVLLQNADPALQGVGMAGGAQQAVVVVDAGATEDHSLSVQAQTVLAPAQSPHTKGFLSPVLLKAHPAGVQLRLLRGPELR